MSEFRRKSRPCDIHGACRDRNCSVETISKTIDEEGVEILRQKDVFGRVPMYYAIRTRCSLPVFRTLFDMCPNAILERDCCGDLPFYMMFRSQTDSRMLEYVLNRNPSLALYGEKRFSGTQTLLQNLCAKWISVVRKKTATSSMSSDSLSSIGSNDNGESNNRDILLTRNTICSDCALLDRWNKLVLTARAAHSISHKTTISETENKATTATASNFDVPERRRIPKRRIPELHIALQLESLPPAVICQFVEMYPEQASIKLNNASIETSQHTTDCMKRADSTCIKERPTSTMYWESSDESSSFMSNMLPLHFFLANYSAKRPAQSHSMGILLKSLIRAFPSAASIEHPPVFASLRRMPTNLPLHVAIAKSSISWGEGIRELVYANPSALGVSDGSGTRMVPFLQRTAIGAAKSCADRDCDGTTALTTSYCLLREDPSVLSSMVASLSQA